MKYLWRLITKYPFSALFILFIWIICLIPIPDTPMDHVRFMDKWMHIALYMALGMTLWAEYGHQHRQKKGAGLFLVAFAFPILMGGAVEIIQATCTGGRRSGEWMDFAADGAGVLLAWIIGMLLAKCLSKGGKDGSADGNCRIGGRR